MENVDPAAVAASPAAPHQPPFQYKANQGYEPAAQEEVPRELLRQQDDAPLPLEGDEEDDYLEDIFQEDDDEVEVEEEEWNADSGDLTKTYNRQRQFNDANGGGAAVVAAVPRSNQQKPSANTFASVDDQVATLSKHAAKLRLDTVKQDDERTKDKADRATSEQVLDQRTRMILLQMINRGVVSEVHGAISTGKEANVYGAVLHHDETGATIQRAIKHRFKGGFDKGNNRKMVKLWAEKEYRNLRRIHSAGIPCPEPLALKLHVLVMGFLGNNKGWAYPRLRDANLQGDDVDQQWQNLYTQLLGMMRKMYQVCKLVHADLSEYNILYHDGKLYIIDVSQSVEPDHPRSLEFLRMDIKNVGDFFRRKGVDTLGDRAIFNFITTPEGPVEEPELSEVIAKLYETKTSAENDEEAAALEVDTEVFRNQYIPQTLEQVYDIEKDVQKLGLGEGNELVYSKLLADQVIAPKAEGEEESSEEDSSEDESGEGASVDDEDSGDESKFDKGRPRGRKFEDKDEKKQHKLAVKEAKREKRKDKMPKHLKKKLVSTTSRKAKK
ncbi:Serine/threonine-protein kinase RIO1 [Cladobotryum mycophilum]|uniref:Serine/threonine-protein kinase RIO1 n=1 Tax=Cladobotryum mycophilum TaxID=491253 RepID=A0ABR0SCD5_9HYPO